MTDRKSSARGRAAPKPGLWASALKRTGGPGAFGALGLGVAAGLYVKEHGLPVALTERLDKAGRLASAGLSEAGRLLEDRRRAGMTPGERMAEDVGAATASIKRAVGIKEAPKSWGQSASDAATSAGQVLRGLVPGASTSAGTFAGRNKPGAWTRQVEAETTARRRAQMSLHQKAAEDVNAAIAGIKAGMGVMAAKAPTMSVTLRSDGMTDAYTRVKNGVVEYVSGYAPKRTNKGQWGHL